MSEIVRLRLANQLVYPGNTGSVAEVVRRLGAVQAQDYGQAVWAVGLRSGATLAEVEVSIEKAEIVRTWPMRGTIHFVPAEDARWMLQLGAARKLAADARRMRELELDEVIVGRAGELLATALQGRKRLSRPDVLQLLETNNISTKNGRGYHILWRLSQQGLLCIGPMIGKQQSFVLLDEWAPKHNDYGLEAAISKLAERYFTSHGPATVQDFAVWSGLKLSEARTAAQALGNLSRLIENGVEYYFTEPPKLAPEHSAYLLPGFDEYFLGYKDRSAVIRTEHSNHVVPGGNGVFKPTIVIDGQIVGIWQRKISKQAVTVTTETFVPAGSLERQLRPALAAYGEFHGLACALAT